MATMTGYSSSSPQSGRNASPAQLSSSVNNSLSNASSETVLAKPFPLSNAAFTVTKNDSLAQPASSSRERRLSPGIARALQDLERKEQLAEERKRRQVSEDGSDSVNYGHEVSGDVIDGKSFDNEGKAGNPRRRVFTDDSDDDSVPTMVVQAIPEEFDASSASSSPSTPELFAQAGPEHSEARSEIASQSSGISAATIISESKASTGPSGGSVRLPSLSQPRQQPRMTKAASLRQGVSTVGTVTETPRRRTTISTAERAAMDRQRRQSQAGPISTNTLAVKAKPSIEVRMSKSALLRAGKDISTKDHTLPRINGAASVATTPELRASRAGAVGFSTSALRPKTPMSAQNTSQPGRTALKPTAAAQSHHRTGLSAETKTAGIENAPSRRISTVPSTARPKVEPKLSRAAMLRLGQAVPARASLDRPMPTPAPAEPRRRESLPARLATSSASSTPRMNRSVLLRLGSVTKAEEGRPAMSKGPAASQFRSTFKAPVSDSAGLGKIATDVKGIKNDQNTPVPSAKAMPRPSLPSSSITPRLNRAAQLRLAKQEAEQVSTRGQRSATLKLSAQSASISAVSSARSSDALTERSSNKA